MHTLLKTVLILMVAAAMSTPVLAGGNANFVLGYRIFNDNEIESLEIEALDGQPVFGVSVDFQTGELPFSWVAGLHLSSREETEDDIFFVPVDVKVTFTEISFGVLKKWEGDGARPYVGGGLTYVNGEIELSAQGSSEDEDDNTVALFGDGGVTWRVGNAFNIGVGGRLVYGAELDVDGAELEADYIQGGLILGWGWDN